MKITWDLREYAAEQGLDEREAQEKGMEAEAVEFMKKGAEIHFRPCPWSRPDRNRRHPRCRAQSRFRVRDGLRGAGVSPPLAFGSAAISSFSHFLNTSSLGEPAIRGG